MVDPRQKHFRIKGEDIRSLAPGRGYCYATDAIVVDGSPVGYMYREMPDEAGDSGWRFFGGTESQDYVDDPANTGIYNVNTIANYDPDVVPLLDAPIGSEFCRPKPGDGLRPLVG